MENVKKTVRLKAGFTKSCAVSEFLPKLVHHSNATSMRLIYLSLIIVFAACAGNGNHKEHARKDGYTKELKTRQDSLYDEVMQGHDVGMAKMGKISRSINAVQATLDSLAKGTKSKVSAAHREALEKVLADLRSAETGMYKWMEEFKLDSSADDSQKREAYLLSERTRVTKVRDDILRSTTTADSLLSIR